MYQRLNTITTHFLAPQLRYSRLQLQVFGTFMFVAGAIFGVYYLANSWLLPHSWASEVFTWTQTDWSGGSSSDVITAASTTYTSLSDVNVSSVAGSLRLQNPSGWYDNAWAHRRPVTIDEAMVAGSTPLTDFPVAIQVTSDELRSVSNGGQVGKSNGGDIFFTDLNGQKLSHELDLYNPSTGALTV